MEYQSHHDHNEEPVDDISGKQALPEDLGIADITAPEAESGPHEDPFGLVEFRPHQFDTTLPSPEEAEVAAMQHRAIVVGALEEFPDFVDRVYLIDGIDRQLPSLQLEADILEGRAIIHICGIEEVVGETTHLSSARVKIKVLSYSEGDRGQTYDYGDYGTHTLRTDISSIEQQAHVSGEEGVLTTERVVHALQESRRIQAHRRVAEEMGVQEHVVPPEEMAQVAELIETAIPMRIPFVQLNGVISQRVLDQEMSVATPEELLDTSLAADAFKADVEAFMKRRNIAPGHEDEYLAADEFTTLHLKVGEGIDNSGRPRPFAYITARTRHAADSGTVRALQAAGVSAEEIYTVTEIGFNTLESATQPFIDGTGVPNRQLQALLTVSAEDRDGRLLIYPEIMPARLLLSDAKLFRAFMEKPIINVGPQNPR